MRRLFFLGFGWMVGGLLACSAPGPEAPADRPQQMRTESDQTDADRLARVRLELAAAYFGRGQFSVALDEVKRSLAAKPDFTDALNLRGLIYGALSERRLAEDSFKRALTLSPRDADTLHNFGWFLCTERRYEEADAQFRQVLALPALKDSVRTLLAQGVCLARSGNLPAAEAALSRSYELDPANAAAGFNLGLVLFQRGEVDRARFYVRRLIAQPEASSVQSLWLAARIEYRLGNLAALEQLGNVLRARYPQSREALLFEKGQFDE